MKTYFNFVAWALGGLLLLVVVVFSLSALGFANFAFFAPKVAQVEYNTFKESQAYNEGQIRDLQNIRLQYLSANPDQQTALRSIIFQRFSAYPKARLPLDLASFYNSLKF